MLFTRKIHVLFLFLTLTFSGYANADWILHRSVDSFTNSDKSTAWLQSNNSQKVGIRGKATKAILVAFKNPGKGIAAGKTWFGEGVMPVGLDHSSGTCYFESCAMLVKFDGKEIVEYDVYQSATGSSSGQLIINSHEFFEQAFVAKKIEIRFNFYQQGNGDFNFTSKKEFLWLKP